MTTADIPVGPPIVPTCRDCWTISALSLGRRLGVKGHADSQADRANGWGREIAWEVHGGPELLDLIATDSADSFDAAKAQAEAAWRRASRAPTKLCQLLPP